MGRELWLNSAIREGNWLDGDRVHNDYIHSSLTQFVYMVVVGITPLYFLNAFGFTLAEPQRGGKCNIETRS